VRGAEGVEAGAAAAAAAAAGGAAAAAAGVCPAAGRAGRGSGTALALLALSALLCSSLMLRGPCAANLSCRALCRALSAASSLPLACCALQASTALFRYSFMVTTVVGVPLTCSSLTK
jgi:hypothetical protein